MKTRYWGLFVIIALLLVFLPAGICAADTLVLPASLQEIGDEAFSGDTQLDEVLLPDTLLSIGERAFADSSVKRIFLPQSINYIADSAFYGAENVTAYGPSLTYAYYFCKEHNIPYDVSDSYQISAFIQSVSSRYGYRDMGLRSHPEGRKQLYDDLLRESQNVWDNPSDISKTDDFYVIGIYHLPDYGLSQDEAKEVYYTFLNDHPVFYFASSTIIIDDEQLYYLLSGEYASGSVRQELNTAISGYLNSFRSCITINDYLSVRLIHDKIIADLTYTDRGDAASHNIIGAVRYKQGVCETYAKTFQLAMNYFGYSSIYVTGRNEGINHVWNMVLLDEKYYYVDCTLDDSSEPWKYFAVGAEKMAGSHSSNTPANTGGYFLYTLPSVSAGDYPIPDDTVYNDGLLEYLISFHDGTAKVTGCADDATEITIPSVVNNIRITAIGEWAFGDNETVQEVKFQDNSNIEVIEPYAFSGLMGLSEIELPSSLRVIMEGAFDRCQNLRSLVLPEGLEEIGQAALHNSGIESLSIPSTLVRYGNWIADEAYQLETITVAENNPVACAVDNVMYLFDDSWFSVTISGGELVDITTQDGWGLFIYPAGKKDTTFTIWEHATLISDSSGIVYNPYLEVFNAGKCQINLNMLKCQILISEDNPYYSMNNGFIMSKDGSQLIKAPIMETGILTTPEGIVEVPQTSFSNTRCSQIIVGEGVTTIGLQAFSYSEATSISLPSTLVTIGMHAFYHCEKLECIIIPDGIQTIEGYTFDSCYALETLDLRGRIEAIGYAAFYGCYNLKDIYYAGTMNEWLAIEIDANGNSVLNTVTVHCSDGTIE